MKNKRKNKDNHNKQKKQNEGEKDSELPKKGKSCSKQWSREEMNKFYKVT